MNSPKFVIYRDIAGGYRWRLKARNGEIVAVSESYVSRQGARNSVSNVRFLASVAVTIDVSV